MKEHKMVVTIRFPDDVPKRFAMDYVREAILNWRGQFHPDDPLNSVKKNFVSVVGYNPYVPKNDNWY